MGGGAVQVFFSGSLLWWVRYDLFECWPGVGGGAVQVFFSLELCCGGYGTIEVVGGCGPFVFAVFSLLSALSAGGCLR